MQTRRDHLQAHRFAMGRLATALVNGDPGRGDSPTRRAALGTFFGSGIVLLLCGGSAVLGLISPAADTGWRDPGAIVVERETGNRYLFLGGTLRPVRNYASALLLAGQGATVHTVAAEDLGGTPHGSPVGIEHAPDSLPKPTALLAGPWTWCLRPDLTGGQLLDLAPNGRTSDLPADRWVLVAGPDGHRFVLWRGVKYPVPDDAALVALGLDGGHALAALPTWLAALPTGVPLAAATITGTGTPAGQVAGHPVTVGQLFETTGVGDAAGDDGSTAAPAGHHYVMTESGVAAASTTEAALLAARPGAPAVLRVNATDIATARLSPDQSLLNTLPDVLAARPLGRNGQLVCLRQQADGTRLTSEVVVEHGPAATGSRTLLIPPTTGMLAVDLDQLAKPNSAAQTYLITDQGIAYPLGESSTAATLGLGTSEVALPESILGALTRGPVLDARTAADSPKEPGR